MSTLPITGAFNDGYISELYETYRRDPGALDESWRQFFKFAESLTASRGDGAVDESLLRKVAGAAALLGAIQRYGHLAVQLDPLGSPPLGAAELKPGFHGITDDDLRHLPASALPPSAAGLGEEGTAADAIQRMRDLYSGPLAYEFEHL